VGTYLRIDVNLVAIVLLGVVYYLAYIRLDHEDAFNKLFFKGCLLILILTGFETFTCIVNGNPSPFPRYLSTFMHVCLFAFPPLMAYYWYLLSNILTTHGNVREMKVNLYYLIPVAANIIMVLLSSAFHLTFFIDNAGVYHRGPFFWFTSVIALFYMIWGLVLLIKRRKNLLRQEFLFLALFCLLPVIGGIIQGLAYGLLLMWSGSALALVIMYLYLQERMMQTDSLTGAWTRHSFEYYVSQNLKSNNRRPFGIIYADVDNLKPVNDLYGHPEGDAALQSAVKAIKSVLRKGDAIARMGGDEFIIQVGVSTRKDLQAVLQRIEDALAQHNQRSGKAYELSLSFGADLFFGNTDCDVDSIIRQVDRLMYDNKRSKKQHEGMETACQDIVQG
jgi:diguanylate cyclase (GGDEF)-like protein